MGVRYLSVGTHKQGRLHNPGNRGAGVLVRRMADYRR